MSWMKNNNENSFNINNCIKMHFAENMEEKNGIELHFYKLINIWLDIRKLDSVGL